MENHKFAVILNAGSGVSPIATTIQQIKDAFAAFDVEPKIFLTHLGSDLTAKTLIAIQEGYDVIVAAGGDGTVSVVASNLIGMNVTLGVLPIGTLNHFAKDLKIPLTIPEAVATLLKGPVTVIDVGTVNDKIFINNSSIGLYQKLVRHRENLQKSGWRKWPAFVSAFLTVMRLYPFLSVRLQIDGQTIVTKTPMVFVGNNEYTFEGYQFGNRLTLTDKLLGVHVANAPSRIGLLKILAHGLFGNISDSAQLNSYKTQELWIESRRKYLHVSLDGEVTVLPTPLHYQIKPAALKVIVPTL